MSPFPTLDPHSSLARPLVHLSLIVGIIMGAILLLVTALVIYACIRYRHKGGQADPPQKFGDKRLEIAWTIGPILILAYLFFATFQAMSQSDPAPSSGQRVDLVIVGHQWWWEARYPDSGVVAANEIHIPVGKRLYVRLKSADVIHDWWIPQLGRKMDAIPGHPNSFWLEADSPGTFTGTCAEYCGAEHAWMRIMVVAEPEAEFEQWTARQLQIPPPSLAGDAEEGAQLFQHLTCSSCHSTASGGTGGLSGVDVGPNLAHIASRRTLAAGRLKNTPANLTEWLSNPQRVKPDAHMPNFQLTHPEVSQLAAYLESLQ